MQQYINGGLVYLPETAEVIAVLGFKNEGGYGKIRKVRISRVVNIPKVIDFAGKMSKATSKEAKRKEQVVEALACPIEHAGLIKFQLHICNYEYAKICFVDRDLDSIVDLVKFLEKYQKLHI
jgi:hypothetical protein